MCTLRSLIRREALEKEVWWVFQTLFTNTKIKNFKRRKKKGNRKGKNKNKEN
jgi:hypothetical protein